MAFDADPNTGVEVYSTAPGSSRGSWQVVGGTSVGAPSWAGIIAIVDQGRALAGEGSLDGPTQTLPALYAAASTEFNTVSSSPQSNNLGFEFGGFGGFDPFGGFGFGGFADASFSNGGGFGFGIGLGFGSSAPTSGATANTETGLGSLNGASLIPDLVASTLTTPLTTSGATGSSGSGSGSGSGTTSPTPPTQPVGKHHAKHSHTVKHTATKRAAVHARTPVKQSLTSSEKHKR